MIRKIIHIDEEKCNGCGLCAEACHEGAIDIVDGKAKLMRENFCDGFGDCLPGCPTGAITFEEREAPEYDENAVKQAKGAGRPVDVRLAPTEAERRHKKMDEMKHMHHEGGCPGSRMMQFARNEAEEAQAPASYGKPVSEEFMRGKVTIIGCPKLDAVDYSDKLTEIIRDNDIKSVTIVRMEVPCCGGLQRAAETALRNSGKFIPWQVVTISRDGRILD